MLFDALVLSIATTAGFSLVFIKLPKSVRDWFVSHSLFAEVTSTVLGYVLLGGTLTALMASAFYCCECSLVFYIKNHQDQFQYLWDFWAWVKDKWNQAKEFLAKLGNEYRASKTPTTPEPCKI